MNKSFLPGLVLSMAALGLMAFCSVSLYAFYPQDKPVSVFPDDIAKILETSCYDCHTDAASNAKAKMKLNFSKWSELSDAKKIGKMEAINDVIKKGDMPPGKYLEHHPDAAPSAEQKTLVDKWVTEESKKLMGE